MDKTIKKVSVVLLHLSLWLFIFIFPIIFIDPNEPHPPLLENISGFILTMVLFYVNYLFLIKYQLFKRKYFTFSLINLTLIILFIVCGYFYLKFTDNFSPPSMIPPPDKLMFSMKKMGIPFDLFLVRNLLSFFLSIGVAVAIRSTRRLKEEESLREKVMNEHLKSEITYLKYQLQPHFFFNTLNNIYALIDRKPDLAKEVLHNLSKLLRYVLYHAEDAMVPLQSEIYFLKTYINLMQIRISSNIFVKFEFPEVETEIKVPPLLFITLVENAYKHGIDATLQGNIYIKMEITISHIVLSVTNSCSKQIGDDQTVSGIGLENLAKRLNILYKPAEFLFTQKQTEKEYFSELKIPAN
jgi:two-component system, LytTR family, sensor histidine kinase AlgZ